MRQTSMEEVFLHIASRSEGSVATPVVPQNALGADLPPALPGSPESEAAEVTQVMEA